MEEFITSGFEAIGFFVVIAIAFFVFVSFMDKKDSEEKNIQNLSNFSDKCRKYEIEHLEKPYLFDEFKKILSDPSERYAAEKKYEEYLCDQKLKDEQIHKEKIKNRVFAYQHELQILEIFDIHRVLERKMIENGLIKKYNVNYYEAKELFNLMVQEKLISKCYNKKGDYFEIGRVLKEDAEIISSNDISRNKWLKMNNKILEPGDEYIISLGKK